MSDKWRKLSDEKYWSKQALNHSIINEKKKKKKSKWGNYLEYISVSYQWKDEKGLFEMVWFYSEENN